jgi:ubiquinone/menaquinone biosynthesis C-methylase UbiE
MEDKTGDTLYGADAQFYDLDNRAPLKADIPFYLGYASKFEGAVLELACGTGRLTIPLAEAGHKIWALEYSEQMLNQFKEKLRGLPGNTADNIHLIHGDMSNFRIGRQFPLILLPARSFQLLLDEEKERSCLEHIYEHLEDDGRFIIEVVDFVKDKADQWVNEEEIFDWENVDPKTGFKVRRTHIKKRIDKKKQIIYPQKIYRVKKPDGTEEKIVKQASWKYFREEQIRALIAQKDFFIEEEMGAYDGKSVSMGESFIFICRKK